IGIAAQAVGIAEAAFRYATQYAAGRTTFGKPIAEHQAIAFKLADMQTKIRAARLLVYEAAWMKDRGERHAESGARAKLYASQVANEVAYEAIQVLGGRGYMKDHPVQRYYRDARVTEIYEGTSEIQRLVISRAILKEQAEAPGSVEQSRPVVG
ncbi:MAG TPA: acyl-CoA dehydrogenase family protein, partial [Rubrobacter sp.]|nr:acyl-CoA dehydrogenase family protein [Rubrobacter sp.]